MFAVCFRSRLGIQGDREKKMKSTKIGMKDELVINSVKAEPSSVLLGPSSKITALVVDDDTLNQMIHRRLLDGLGVQNQVVGNGKEAVDVHSSGKSFDLILMDKDMPVMNGIEVRTYICINGENHANHFDDNSFSILYL